MNLLSPLIPRCITLLGVGGLLVAGALAGAVLTIGRGPNPGDLPRLIAVTMEDGDRLFIQPREVTVADWSRCHEAGGCSLALRAPNDTIGIDYPATGLSWTDAMEYITWISAASRHPFRLPSIAEWTAVAAPVLPDAPDPIFTDPALTWASAYLTEGLTSRRLQPSGSNSMTDAGIADLDGNVWEWTQDCIGDAGADQDRCAAFYVAGEHLSVMSYMVRDPARGGCAVGSPPAHLGLRLVSDHAP